MKRVTLTRLESTDQGTFGRLVVDDQVFLTGELPWRDNASGISCIPPGVYQAHWTFSPHLKRHTYGVGPVAARTHILIHSANLMGGVDKGLRAQLNGCVALGEKLGWMEGQKALLLSAPAVRKFEDFMEQKPFELEIQDGEHS